MKQTNLIEKIQEIENKINAFGDIQAKSGEVETLLQRTRDISSQIDQDKQTSTQLRNEIAVVKGETLGFQEVIQNAKSVAENYSNVIDQNNNKASDLLSKLTATDDNIKSLEAIIKDQLGLVNAGILSNSFKGEADKLEESVNKRFWWILGSTIVLLAVAFTIVVWEIRTTNNFWSSNFALKATLTTPLIFFLVFITKLYNREKRLYEEYIFKSTVALSFEAYRKLLKEDGDQQADQSKVLEFLISSISRLYASPMENMHKHFVQDDDIDVDILGKIADIFKKFIK